MTSYCGGKNGQSMVCDGVERGEVAYLAHFEKLERPLQRLLNVSLTLE